MSTVKLWALILFAGVVVAVFSSASGNASSVGSLAGTVKSADGQPMEGVAVSARADGPTTITTTVYTNQEGRYMFPPLTSPMERGQYHVWAQAVGFAAGRATARLSAGQPVAQDFTLTPIEDFAKGKQLSGVEWLASLPEATPEDRRLKRILFVNCTQCHQSGFVLQKRFDAVGWSAILDYMERANHTGAASRLNNYVHAYREEIVEYLSRVRGPGSTLTYKPLPRVTGESTNVVITEYDISPGHVPGYVVSQNGRDWSRGTPSRIESSSAHDAVVDSQGYVWLGDSVSPERSLAKLDPRTGRTTNYRHLDKKGRPVAPHDLVVDDQDNIWFNNNSDGTIDKFDPKTETFQHFPRPESLPHFGNGMIDLDSKGNVWAGVNGGRIQKRDPKSGVEHSVVDPQQPGGTIRLDTKTGEYTFYPAMTPIIRVYGAAVDANDTTWFTQVGAERMGFVDGRTGDIGEVTLTKMDGDDVEYTDRDFEIASTFEPNDHQGSPWQKGPRRQAPDKNGDANWVTLSKGGALLKIDINTKKLTEYPLPYRYSFPYHAAVDRNHMVWVSGLNTDRVFKFDPFTEKFTEYDLPTRGTDIRFVAVDNTTDPPEIWVPYYQSSKMARIQFRTDTASPTTAARSAGDSSTESLTRR